jgi:hypothetical protein
VLLRKKEKDQSGDSSMNTYSDDNEDIGVYESEDQETDSYSQEEINEAMGTLEMGDVEIPGQSFKYKPDYGNYELFEGVGVLTRFNPPSFNPETKYDQIIPHHTIDGETFKNIVIVKGKVV